MIVGCFARLSFTILCGLVACRRKHALPEWFFGETCCSSRSHILVCPRGSIDESIRFVRRSCTTSHWKRVKFQRSLIQTRWHVRFYNSVGFVMGVCAIIDQLSINYKKRKRKTQKTGNSIEEMIIVGAQIRLQSVSSFLKENHPFVLFLLDIWHSWYNSTAFYRLCSHRFRSYTRIALVSLATRSLSRSSSRTRPENLTS